MSQAWTAVRKRELKEVLDEKLNRHMGIAPADWRWATGILDTALVRGHGVGNLSLMNGWPDTLFSWGQLTASRVSRNGSSETVRK